MGMAFSGVLGFIILVLDVWAIVSTVQSPAETGTKVLWIVLIIVLPVLGIILWVLFGPRGQMPKLG
jgi:succinate dehydrogenase/fumarate reductase cytochrome b subunit